MLSSKKRSLDFSIVYSNSYSKLYFFGLGRTTDREFFIVGSVAWWFHGYL